MYYENEFQMFYLRVIMLHTCVALNADIVLAAPKLCRFMCSSFILAVSITVIDFDINVCF